MSTEMTIALQITLIGMGLVFGAILLLWALMAALVRITADPLVETARWAVSDDSITKSASVRAGLVPAPSPGDQALRRHVALAAIAVALAQQRPGAPATPGSTTIPSTAHVSTWQAVTRSQQLKQRGPIRR